ncbi:MAG: ASPIC/UnbV domain-containing protein [Acidobacteria bacterium]|nr:ASPIC/UnbV domain-containing protein [Acidobacteriota bacterium]
MIEEQARGFRGSFSGYERDRLFYNPDGGDDRFLQLAYVFGLDDDHDGRAAAPVDIDGDGDLDLALLTLRGLKLLENTSAPRHFARVRLAAGGSAAHALGAEVVLRAGGVARRDFVKLTEGFRAQVPLDLHFGLGDATAVDTLEVRWPSGETGVWRDLPVDRLLIVDEAAGTVEAEPLRRWSDGSRPTMTGAPSPAVVARALDGGRGPLAGGRPTVVNFWAPWCPPCNVELPELVDLAGRYDGEVDFAGVSVELEDLDSVRESIERFEIPYPQFLADDAVMERFFGSEDEAALPATFVFDQHGRLRRLFRGAVTQAELDLLLASFRDEAVSEDTLRMLAETYRRAGDYARAAEFYGQLGALEPTRLDQIGQAWQRQRALDWIAKARAHRALGEVADARESYDRALQMEPGNRTARREREALGAR